jgi:hypothetical protein
MMVAGRQGFRGDPTQSLDDERQCRRGCAGCLDQFGLDFWLFNKSVWMPAVETPGLWAYGTGSPERGGSQQKTIHVITGADRVFSGV